MFSQVEYLNQQSDATDNTIDPTQKRSRKVNKKKVQDFIEEIGELKKQRLQSAIEKNRAKTEVYKKKLDVLKQMLEWIYEMECVNSI